jgi:polar amino acid transport system permease protein
MGYHWQFGVLSEYWVVFVHGAVVTAELTGFAFALALVLGLFLALGRLSESPFIRAPVAVYVEFFRSTPALVQLVWIYYAMPILTGIKFNSLVSVGIGLGLHTAAYYCEVFRAGILAVERGQVDAAKAVGMRRAQLMRRVILPQAVRQMIPPFINETASLIKLTTLGSVLAVSELLHASNNLITTTYRPLEIYTALALIFAAIIYPIVYLSRRLERYWAARS